jgi:hypothetical protein
MFDKVKYLQNCINGTCAENGKVAGTIDSVNGKWTYNGVEVNAVYQQTYNHVVKTQQDFLEKFAVI